MKKITKIILIIFISLICSIENIKAEEIPKVYLEGDINNMIDKTNERKIYLSYTSDNLNFEAYALIKIQGSSSVYYNKKNYTIKLYSNGDYTTKKKVNVGYGDESKYCLKANWIDKTHARNIVTANITSNIQKQYNLFNQAPNNGLIDGFPVEIYINKEFLGIYTWNIPKDEWMFNMDKNNPNHIVISGQIYSEETDFQKQATPESWEVEIGPNTDETFKKFNRVIDFISTSTDKEFRDNFENYLNLDATLNYYIILELAALRDNVSKNLLMATYDGIVWYPTLYDLDTSWGTTWNGLELQEYDIPIINKIPAHQLWTKFTRNFPNEIANRYFELRKKTLTKDNILNEFNNFSNKIPNSSLEKENNRWENIPGQNIKQIEEFLNTRIPIIDEYMYNLYDINPEIKIEYSTTKTTLKSVEVKLIPNRTDISITKDGKKINGTSYLIKENGKYTFEYIDWKDNTLGTITLEVDWIIDKKITTISIILILVIISLITFTFKQNKNNQKEKTEKKNNSPKNNNNSQNKKKEKKKSANK